MVTSVLALLFLAKGIPKQINPQEQALQLLRRVAETDVRFEFGQTPAREKPEVAKRLSQSLDLFTGAGTNPWESLIGKSPDLQSQVKELFIGFVDIARDLASVEATIAENSSKNQLSPEDIQLYGTLTERRTKFSKAFDVLRVFCRKNLPIYIIDKLSPPAYYMLCSPYLRSEGDPQFLSPTAEYIVPDFDFGNECLVAGYFQTKSDTDASQADYENRKTEAGGDVLKIRFEDPLAKLMRLSTLKPGDTVFAIRARGKDTWLYVSNWRELSKKIDYYAFELRIRTVDLLAGHDRGAARPVPAQIW